MMQINLVHIISAFFIGLGFILNLLALYSALKPQIRRVEGPVFPQIELSASEETKSVEKEFESLTNYESPVEYDTTYEVPGEHIRPGDLLKTARMPPLVQTFKFREKIGHPASARA